MKPHRAITKEDAQRLADLLIGTPLPFSLTIGDGNARSLSQNALLHKWFGEIAKHFGDRDATTVKGECHHKYGLPIKKRCEQFLWVWSKTGEQMGYERQCKYLASGVLNVSSSLSVKELKEYMDGMMRDYADIGVFLTDPELRKYEGVAA